MTKKNKVCIVGGGTAGWVTLSYLAATTNVELCIIHTDKIEKINVGESTAPTIKHVTDTIGIPDDVWMKSCNATFKYGVEFTNFASVGSEWLHSFDDLIPHNCFHTPLCDNGKVSYKKDMSSVDYYLNLYNSNPERFNRYHGPLTYMLENNISPFDQNNSNNISKFPGFAYHINTYKFGQSLKKFTDAKKYREINEEIVDVCLNEKGISHVILESGEKIYADIFFDCTGFSRLLIKNFSDWKCYNELSNNSAIWGYIPDTYSYRPVTGAHAQECGWIWEIPTYGQIGTGYVYCDRYCDEERAIKTITDYWSKRGHEFKYLKSAKFSAGRNKHTSINNVICNGLSQSFIEPLEATSIMIICTTIKSFVDMYRKTEMWGPRRSEALNRVMNKFIDHTKQFVLYHYRLSKRTDTEYWRDVNGTSEHVQQVCDYIENLADMKWVNKGQTLLNQWNWTSMLLGYGHEYKNKIESIDNYSLQNYEFYSKILIEQYQYILRNNMTTKDFLTKINND